MTGTYGRESIHFNRWNKKNVNFVIDFFYHSVTNLGKSFTKLYIWKINGKGRTFIKRYYTLQINKGIESDCPLDNSTPENT